MLLTRLINKMAKKQDGGLREVVLILKETISKTEDKNEGQCPGNAISDAVEKDLK